MAGYAQQDAEECWGAILGNLKDVPIEGGNGGSNKKFVESYMMGTMRREQVTFFSPTFTSLLIIVPFQVKKYRIHN